MIHIDVFGMEVNGLTHNKTYYWLNTSFACGGICVDRSGYIDHSETCPMYRKVFSNQKFWKKFDQLKRSKKIISMVKIGVGIKPSGGIM
jgi:hypothetical protein